MPSDDSSEALESLMFIGFKTLNILYARVFTNSDNVSSRFLLDLHIFIKTGACNYSIDFDLCGIITRLCLEVVRMHRLLPQPITVLESLKPNSMIRLLSRCCKFIFKITL